MLIILENRKFNRFNTMYLFSSFLGNYLPHILSPTLFDKFVNQNTEVYNERGTALWLVPNPTS